MSELQEVIATSYYRTFSKSWPVLARIEPGTAVATKTVCTGGQDLNDEHLSEPGNPLTGPFYIEGAEPAVGYAGLGGFGGQVPKLAYGGKLKSLRIVMNRKGCGNRIDVRETLGQLPGVDVRHCSVVELIERWVDT